MKKNASSIESVLAKAEQAIRDDLEREKLLDELWQQLGVADPQVADGLFKNGDAHLNGRAEQELLDLVRRQRAQHDVSEQGGSRPRRSLLMRGIVI